MNNIAGPAVEPVEQETFAHELTVITTRPDGSTGVVYGEIQSQYADPQTVAREVMRAAVQELGPGRLRTIESDL